MKFKVDENLPAETAEILLRAGHDAVTVAGQGLQGAADGQVLSACHAEDRILVTLDLGSADIRAYPPGSHSSLIVFRLQRQDKQTVVRTLARLMNLLPREPLAGHLWIVDEERVRIRGQAM